MGGNSNEMLQRGMGGAQIVGGTAMLASGDPMGAMFLANGLKSEASTNPNQGPLTTMTGGPSSPINQVLNSGQMQPQQPPIQPPTRPQQINVQSPAPQTMGTQVPQAPNNAVGGQQQSPMQGQQLQRLMMLLSQQGMG